MTLIERRAAAGRRRPRAVPAVSVPLLAMGVVLAAVLFNAVLALANAHAFTVNSAVVIACEMMITGAAVALALTGPLHHKQPWIVFVGLLVLIPVFVLLGLSCDRRDAIRVVMILQVVVLAVMLFEAVAPEQYGKLFDPMSYYINSRGFQQDSFWNQNSDLFVSATRPGERFLLGGLDIHRLSSVFLEPVSLGNYCVIVAIVAAALWPSLSVLQRLFILGSEFLILVGCDGRFAAVCIIAVVALRFAAPALPRYSNWFYLPGLLAVVAAVVTVYAISPQGDDFPSRSAGSIRVLSLLGPAELIGMSTYYAYQVMDSGISYLVLSQSLAGALVIWSFIALGMPPKDRAAAVTVHGASLYTALLLMISYSLFSIKTAALLWFCYGAIARAVSAPMRAPRRRAVPAVPEGLPA